MLKGGRGFGKTLAGAHWLAGEIAAGAARSGRGGVPLRIALVGATLDEARRIMVEGPSGLLAVAADWVSDWAPTLRRLSFRTGAEATLFSGASPEQLRGPEHHLAWCDELAKWEKPKASWDMLQLGLRLGDRPRALVTTTPRPGPVLSGIMAEPGTIVTGGPTRANPHLAESWKRAVEALYAGTRLGRQELEGELLTDTPGALWWPELLERCRLGAGQGRRHQEPSPSMGSGLLLGSSGGRTGSPDGWVGVASSERLGGGHGPPHPRPLPIEGRGDFVRIVVAVDPPAGDGTCGIIACARDEAGRAHVLADHSVAGRTPEGWARAVADAASLWGHLYTSVPVSLVAEQNQGGKMVAAVLRTADPSLRVKLVTATAGKTTRAEPVAQLFEAGRVTLHGRFPELEAQLCGMIAGGGYEGPGTSLDRADAMVWGLTELMLGREQAEPRVRLL